MNNEKIIRLYYKSPEYFFEASKGTRKNQLITFPRQTGPLDLMLTRGVLNVTLLG